MEQRATVIQKAADLISQYDHFLTAVKERAASFSANAASVNHSIEADFEALHVMLEQRKKVLLAQVQEEMTASRENDILELEAKQRKMHSSLQQLQQLVVQGLLSEDNECYQQLLAELTEAKQKLKETSDKFQIKFEGFLKPLAGKIANYARVVSGRGNRDDEQTSMVDTSKGGVDFARVFAVLSSQFEARCQLQATRKEVKYFSENPLNGWFEYSKKLQWRRTTTALSSKPAVPDYASIIKKLKDDFINKSLASVAHPINVPDESYKKWLLPQPDKHPDAPAATISTKWLSTSATLSDDAVIMATPSADAVTKGFNAIANSDSSSWLLHSSFDDRILSEDHGYFNADTSPWLLRSSSEEDKLPMVVPPEQDYNEWLNPVKEIEKYQTWLTAETYEKQPSTEDDVSNWLDQGYSWTDHSNVQWLLPRGCSTLCDETFPPGGDSGGDIHSDIFGSTQTLTSFGSSDFEIVDDADL